MFNFLLLKFITLLHILIILFIVGVPFTNSKYLLLIHIIIIPFIMLHWVLNDNTCALTVVERKLRKNINGAEYDDDDCITCKLIEPIYDFRKNYDKFTIIIYMITTLLWGISVGKLVYKYNSSQITSFKDLFIL